MLRTYDLLLQAKAPGEPFARELVQGALVTAGATLDEQGRGGWRLPEGSLEVAPVLEAGACIGLEVKVPLSDKTDLLEATVKALAEVTERVPARLVDPQRGELASVAALNSTTSEFFRLARHAGEYGAVSEALGLSTWAAAEPERDSASTRVLLALVAFVLALYATWVGVSSLLEREPEAPVDPPAKVRGQ